jgi:bifunctional DNA-binding transcriptional regulator/antitoxin component of YhaV-PrlF toxin-antitoxin module
MGKNEQFMATVSENGMLLMPKEFRDKYEIPGGTKVCLEYIGNIKETVVSAKPVKDGDDKNE